jgi:hypothetical protein
VAFNIATEGTNSSLITAVNLDNRHTNPLDDYRTGWTNMTVGAYTGVSVSGVINTDGNLLGLYVAGTLSAAAIILSGKNTTDRSIVRIDGNLSSTGKMTIGHWGMVNLTASGHIQANTLDLQHHSSIDVTATGTVAVTDQTNVGDFFYPDNTPGLVYPA